MIEFFHALVTLIAVFLAPGYVLLRALRSRISLPTTFGLSSLLVFYVVFFLGVFHVPLRPDFLLGALFIFTFILGFAFRRIVSESNENDLNLATEKPTADEHSDSKNLRYLELLIYASVALLVATFSYRLLMAPLMGADVSFRWNFLAERILEHREFSFYPPLSSEDYQIYFFTDAIPPLIPFSYFFIYSVLGSTSLTGASLLVITQFLAICDLCMRLSKELFGSHAAIYSLALLLSSPLHLWSVGLGQETAWLILSTTGHLLFLLRYKRFPKISNLLLAAVFVSLGCISREHGWSIYLSAVVAALLIKLPIRALITLSLLSAGLALPWYTRTFLLTGNPFYSNSVGGFLPVNPIHHEIMQYIATRFGFSDDLFNRLAELITHVATQATCVLVLGVFASVYFFRTHHYIIASIIINVLVWLYAVKFTSSDLGSTRILAPSLALLAVLVSGMLAKVSQKRSMVRAASLLGVLGLLWFFAPSVVAYPQSGEAVTIKNILSIANRQYRRVPSESKLLPVLRQRITTPSFRILSDNAFAHASFYNSPYQVVPIWSPEVRMIFDSDLKAEKIRAALQSIGIAGVLHYPNTSNARYLETSSFYGRDMKNWIKVIEMNGIVFYAFP